VEKTKSVLGEQGILLICSTFKRAEGRASVWGSEFTIKVATLQGDSADFAAELNVKLWDSVVRGGGVLPGFWNSRAQSSFQTYLNLREQFRI
jgi:hypothetical protein